MPLPLVHLGPQCVDLLKQPLGGKASGILINVQAVVEVRVGIQYLGDRRYVIFDIGSPAPTPATHHGRYLPPLAIDSDDYAVCANVNSQTLP